MVYNYFNINEFTCKCGCGQARMKDSFLIRLDKARGVAGIPFIINSGFRCEEHNKKVGSTSTNHVRGVAADIRCGSSQARFKVLKSLIDTGFDRIGIHRTFIHCDENWDGPKGVIWFY